MKLRIYDYEEEKDFILKLVTYFEENEDFYYTEYKTPMNGNVSNKYSKDRYSFTNISEDDS